MKTYIAMRYEYIHPLPYCSAINDDPYFYETDCEAR
jgi:hypothetical protein